MYKVISKRLKEENQRFSLAGSYATEALRMHNTYDKSEESQKVGTETAQRRSVGV